MIEFICHLFLGIIKFFPRSIGILCILNLNEIRIIKNTYDIND